jgi:hypothetical protein
MSDLCLEKPLLLSGPRARKLLCIGNTKYWRLVKAGLIETAEVGARKMPTYRSVEALARPTERSTSEAAERAA